MGLKKIKKHLWILRSLPQSIYFNLHYLPLSQAIKLPILLYKPKFFNLKGKVVIYSKEVRFGMIQLGKYLVETYPNTGIRIQNHGGTIVFRGNCFIGGNSSLWIGSRGRLDIGGGFSSAASLTVCTSYRITFGKDDHIGWDCKFMDSDNHKLTKVDGGYSKGFGSIEIGDNCWFGTECLALKRTKLPAYTTVQARTVLDREYDIPRYSIIGPVRPVEVKVTGYYRNYSDDKIEIPVD